ncbi:GerMN domain-containing protein [Kribbella deserti]|uniref:GerMN domain-containing protein n=1 Tax=Kribbella deserti TaxID=1926257 RepID=A0ABV6QH10_9ACTN
MIRPPIRSATTLAVVLALVCACGVRPQEHPDPVESLSAVVPSSSTPTAQASTTGTPATAVVYLIRSGRLAAVSRPGADPQSLLRDLLAGPTSTEFAAGLRSAIPATGGAITVTIDGRLARVQLPDEFTRLGGAQQALAVAQLVFTLTEERLGLSAVRLMRGQRELSAPTATGELVARPVTRADYASVAPR